MKNKLIAVYILLLLIGSSFGQTPKNDTESWEVSICPVRLIGGGTTDFNGTINYIAKTDNNGQLIDIVDGRKTVMGKFVDLTEFIPCMKGWRLSPADEYSITFGVGVIGFDRNPNYISVVGKTKKIKIILPPEIFEWNPKRTTTKKVSENYLPHFNLSLKTSK